MSNERQTRTTLVRAGLEWRRAADAELARRAARDSAIRAASEGGMNPAAIARAVGMDRGAVFRIISGDRGAAARRA